MSRTHVEILGVQIPLRGLAFVTSTPPQSVWATISSYQNRYSVSSPGIAKAIAAFNKAAEGKKTLKVIPITAGVNRQFFSYAPLSSVNKMAHRSDE